MDEIGLRREWPLRLLHVPSMTSIVRQEGNRYGNCVEPAYSILSYTWGRWKLPSENPALNVRGIDWKVPAVDEKHFSVAQLENAIWRISLGRGTEADSQAVVFVWIDVACIHQENEMLKAIEVGRQAAIFKNAAHAYVWLNHLGDFEIRECDRALFDIAETLSSIPNSANDETQYLDRWIDPFTRVSQTFLQDPWFTSLWTLQEMFLRADAQILSRDSNVVERSGGNGNYLALGNLIINCTSVYTTLMDQSSNVISYTRAETDAVLELIERLGLYYGMWENSMLLLIAARHRHTRRPKDRIYGIMQVYDFKLGTSAQPDKEFTLEDLEFQLAAAHNTQSPVYAQMFIHTEVVDPGHCWRIIPSSRIPQELLFTELGRKSLCKISFGDTAQPLFTGKACSLENLLEFWRGAYSTPDGDDEQDESSYAQTVLQDILIDLPELVGLEMPPEYGNETNEFLQKFEMGRFLVAAFGESVQVLLLGSLIDGIDEDIDMLAGLIVRCRPLGTVECWQRMGICLWAASDELLLKEAESNWSNFVGFLG